MTLFLLNVAVWLILLHIRRNRLKPYRVEDDEQPAAEAPDRPETDPEQDCFTVEEIARLEDLKREYFTVLDAIEQEQADLKKEYQHASDKRRSAISSKLTSLASRHAATTRMFCGVESKIEKLYNGG